MLPRGRDERDLAGAGTQPDGDEEPDGREPRGHGEGHDREDQPGRPGEAADDGHVDQHRHQRSADEGDGCNRQVADVVLHVEEQGQYGRHRPDGSGREVDDPVRAVDEDQPHGHDPVQRAEGDAGDHVVQRQMKAERPDLQGEVEGGGRQDSPHRPGGAAVAPDQLHGLLQAGDPAPRALRLELRRHLGRLQGGRHAGGPLRLVPLVRSPLIGQGVLEEVAGRSGPLAMFGYPPRL